MESHIKVVGWLYIVLGALGLIAGGCLFVTLAGIGLISGERDAFTVLSIIAIAISAFLILISAPGIVAGAGLLAYKPWARILALILAVLNLANFPLGTILGVYSLYALMDDDSVRLFNAAASS